METTKDKKIIIFWKKEALNLLRKILNTKVKENRANIKENRAKEKPWPNEKITKTI